MKDKKLRSLREKTPQGLLFFGLPGTGKKTTQKTKHLNCIAIFFMFIIRRVPVTGYISIVGMSLHDSYMGYENSDTRIV